MKRIFSYACPIATEPLPDLELNMLGPEFVQTVVPFSKSHMKTNTSLYLFGHLALIAINLPAQ